MPRSPSGRKRIGNDFPPAARSVRSMVDAHTGAFTGFALGGPACWCTLLLLSIWLDDVNLAELVETLTSQLLEPGLWQFPIAFARNPSRVPSTDRMEPSSIIRLPRQACQQGITGATTVQHRNGALIPNLPKSCAGAFVHGRPSDPDTTCTFWLTKSRSVDTFT